MLSVRKPSPQLLKECEKFSCTPVALPQDATYQEGKTYWDGYFGKRYKVLDVSYTQYGKNKVLDHVTVQWQDGDIVTHQTRLDPKHDWVLEELRKVRMLHTPVGDFPMPRGTAEMLDGMSDIELLEAYVKQFEKTASTDPFVFQEMQDRRLVFTGDYHKDLVDRLEKLKECASSTPVRLFVDMDGTLAVFHPVTELETLYEPGYFAGLEPQENVVHAVRTLIRESPEIEVYALSAVLGDSLYAVSEKNTWLDRNVPEMRADRRLFPPCGTDKKQYVPGGIRSTDFLLDDYTQNLIRWPGQGIKLLTAINHTRGTWKGDRIRYDKAPEEIAGNLLQVMQGGQVMDEKPDLTWADVLKEVENQAWNNVLAYSGNYAMTIPKKGFEAEWERAVAKAAVVGQIVQELPGGPADRQYPTFEPAQQSDGLEL